MRKTCCLFLTMLLLLGTLFAGAEERLGRMPGKEEVQKAEAEEIALSFLEEAFSFSRQEWPTETRDASFRLSALKKENSEEYCWFLTLKNEIPMHAVVQIHGKTGDVISWGCDGGKNLTNFYEEIEGVKRQSFLGAMPESKAWLNAENIYWRACADFSYHSGVSMKQLPGSMDISISYGKTNFMGWLPQEAKGNGLAIQYELIIHMPAAEKEENSEISGAVDKWTYMVTYSMTDGQILAQQLLLNDEEQPLRLHSLKK